MNNRQCAGSGQPSAGRRHHAIVKNGLCFGICIALWLAYLAIYLPFLPTAFNTVGHDYSYHLPSLLTGYYWVVQNGLWATPWFSPSQCGGFPFIADPNVLYYSVTQLFVFAVSPMRAVQLTFALFALIGMAGTWLLMRHSFRASHAAATVAAALFLFNGFFTYRILIGHLTFHAFALVPLMTAAVLPPRGGHRLSFIDCGARICVAALCLAYMLQSGMVHGIPPALIATAVIMLIHGVCFGWRLTPFVMLAVAGLLSLALCAGRLAVELALLSNFPRDDYSLPGISGIGNALWSLFQTLFLDLARRPQHITNAQWLLDRHEWEYGVSLAPLLIAIVWATIRLLQRPSFKPTIGGSLGLVAILILLALPLALNIYEPGWNGFLKSLPYFGSSSSLVRFFSAYIPVLIVIAALALDRTRLPGPLARHSAVLLAVAAIAVVLCQNITTDRSSYATNGYYILPIETEYARVSTERTVPSIEAIGGPRDQLAGRNDGLTKGVSQIACYQPLLGYRLEKFPRAPLRPGPVIAPIGDVINLKNPACYLYPQENNCRPGDHFTIDSLDDAVAFMTYRPFPFERPDWQDAASGVSLAALAATLAFLLMALLRLLIRKRT